MKKAIKTALCVAFSLAVIACASWVGWRAGRGLFQPSSTTIVRERYADTVRDTVTSVSLVYREVVRHDTLVVADTTVIVRDGTIYAPVPISSYALDTTVAEVCIHAVMSGYDVSLDTLAVAVPPAPREPLILPSVGIGLGTRGVGVFVGVGVRLR